MKKQIPKDRRLRAFVIDRKTGQPLLNIPILVNAELKRGKQVPLGVLVSDHAGFVSFDLEPLREAYEDVEHIWICRLGDEGNKIDALDIYQLAPGLRGVPILADPLPKCQYLSRNEWLAEQGIDPYKVFYSFRSVVTNPSARVGEGGCEILLPSNSATHIFRFRQVIRTIGSYENIIQPMETADGSTIVDLPEGMRLARGYVYEYKVTWYPLGHSLGQLLYSLPLAPCESVNLAVIDWSRRDEGARFEDTTFSERLIHNQRRDRMIEETVKASLTEWQGGGSFMAGHAGAGSFDLGGILSLGAADAMGGSYSSSGGERELAATNVQRLSDNIEQKSTAIRNLRSTVITQISQQEHESIETRTVTNHNHCHALTVLYYEVLRHYRVITECVSRQRVYFVDYDVRRFDRKIAFCQRTILERVLLDPRLRDCFDPIERLLYCTPERLLAEVEAGDRAEQPFIEELLISITTEDGTDGDVVFLLDLADGSVLTNDMGHTGFDDEGDRHRETWKPEGEIRPTAIKRVGFRVKLDFAEGEWRARKLRVRYKLSGEEETYILYDKEGKENFKPLEDDGDEWWDTVEVQPNGQLDQAEARLRERVKSDQCCADRLVSHLNCHKVYYWNVIWLFEDPNERAYRLSTESPYKEARLLGYIENRPVGAFGDDIAFPELGSKPEPATDENGDPIDPVINFVALPVHGVFAEAQLGHCNACEERDITRFWDWSESPCPERAPEIAPIVAGSRAQELNLQPSTMPSPVVNIVNPPAAPDPTGLVAAMDLLATSNIFRDMSGLKELSDLLQKLSEGAVNLAQARTKAQQILGQQQQGGLEGLTPREQHDQNQVTRNAGQHGELTEEEVRERVSNTTQPRRTLPPQVDQQPEDNGQQPVPIDLRTVEIRLRGFVPSEIWEPSLGFPIGMPAQLLLLVLRFNGDNRFFSADQGTSRVDLPVRLQLNANDMSIVNFDEGRRGSFGIAEVYFATDTEDIPGMPEWAESKNADASPIGSLVGRLEATPENLQATANSEDGSISVRLRVINARAYFPFSENFIAILPDFDVDIPTLGSVNGKDYLRFLLDAGLPGLDADIRIRIAKREDGELEYQVSGSHDGFPAWELYVNGDEAMIPFNPDTDDAPSSLQPPLDQGVFVATKVIRRIE